MAGSMKPSLSAAIIRNDFAAFVWHAFKAIHGEPLGNQPYLRHLCHEISKFIEGDTKRLLINLPPQHLKSFAGTVCLAAYLLGTNPRLRIILVAYNDVFAETLCGKIRDLMKSDWYQATFATRIKDGHSRANDFATQNGGGVFAASATGAITGRAAEVVIYDDPHEINDWNNERKLELVWSNFNTLLSRLRDKVKGRIIVIAHRVSESDLSSKLLQEKGWSFVRLPLVAVKTRKYDLGHDEWVRKKGDVLQPTAYPASEVERLQRTQVAPPYDLFFQQGVNYGGTRRIRPEHFQSFLPHELPLAPIVLSIDPGYDRGPNASKTVVQAWKNHGGKFYLVDQYCDSCDGEELRRVFWQFARRHQPSVALIENTANGPSLHARVRGKAKFEIKMITPRRAPKLIRLKDHLTKIVYRKVFLPEGAAWRDDFVAEVANPSPEFHDIIDAMTQYFDFADLKLTIVARPPRGSAGIALGTPIAPLSWWLRNIK
jgi:predicted phage terminase large subunit-like protein